MGIFEHFPYSNFHNLNLDRILERTKAAEEAAQAAEAAAEAAAASIATIANAPADVYKELTIANGYLTHDVSNALVPTGGEKFCGFTLTGSNIILSLYGLLIRGSKSVTANTAYKLLSFDASIAAFLPERMFSTFYASTDKGHGVIVQIAYNQTDFAPGDGVFVVPLTSFSTDAAGEAIVVPPSVVPFFSDIV